MKRFSFSINLAHIITLIMLGLIFAALIAGRISDNTKGTGASHGYGAPANAKVSR